LSDSSLPFDVLNDDINRPLVYVHWSSWPGNNVSSSSRFLSSLMDLCPLLNDSLEGVGSFIISSDNLLPVNVNSFVPGLSSQQLDEKVPVASLRCLLHLILVFVDDSNDLSSLFLLSCGVLVSR